MRVAVILTLDQPLSFFRIAFRSAATRTTVAEHAIAFVGPNKLEVLAQAPFRHRSQRARLQQRQQRSLQEAHE